jgi:hypothetical protein
VAIEKKIWLLQKVQYLFMGYMVSRIGLTGLRIAVPLFYSLAAEELIIPLYLGSLCYILRVKEPEILRLKMTADGRMMIMDTESPSLAKAEMKEGVIVL